VAPRRFGSEVSPFRARLIASLDKKWVNGTRLHYYFYDQGPYAGGEAQQPLVRDAFRIWQGLGIGITFQEVTDIGEAEIRIGFLAGDGAWSYVGRDAIDLAGQGERTMNFGWDLATDPRGLDTPIHEIGHALGFLHEHQNPFAGIQWDEQAVYDYFAGPPNDWDRETIYYNVLRKLPASAVLGTPWDPDSVMHYAFPAGLIREPGRFRDGLTPAQGLSAQDVAEVRRLYPPLEEADYARLQPLRSAFLGLAPGEQKNFLIEPPSSADYTMQTFGRSDTVMVLFEAVDGQWRYLAGDDDSGSEMNASLQARLRQERRYLLRIRLYLNNDGGDTAVMLW